MEEKKWADLTPAEKREQRYQWWLNPDIKFSSPEAEKKYKERALRFIQAYRVEKPDKVPVSLPVQNRPAYLAGNEFAKGEVAWLFDKTDMVKAKQILGKTCCISGNVPSSMVVTGDYKMVKEYCRKVIETCAPGGGFILAGGAQVDEGNPENLRAMLDAAKEYGKY